MQVVFMNTLEKEMNDGRVSSGQVSISEKQGIWHVMWQEESADRGADCWFEGASWEEMITTFRHGIAIKMGEGYSPVLDGMLDDRTARGAGGLISFIQCYGEMHAQQDLFEALREWRRGKAIELKKAAYVVATNRMLWMISAFVPHQAAELIQIPGWGETKNIAYAEEVLAITRLHEQSKPFPLHWVMDALDDQVYTQWLYKQKENKFKLELDRQQEKRLILSGVQEGQTLEELQKLLELPRRELLERVEQLEKEGYDMEPLIGQELSSVPEAEQERIWAALAAVGDRYLKPVLSHAYDEDELKSRQVDQLYDRLRLIRLRYRRGKDASQQAI
ncbi:HRDC domain-containing protein [Paenibacillus daejeonensis]|uniref:HRDC domain-containing protein n=1 Tax=Paenibacillus daejeonensis TaxID=135193 RepID=UPI00035FB682|nr:HRDC domain-containing protein [Paenibacillus daejeonensis]